ncbi:MAG: DUF6165 family protein [Ramlibacter sp.]|nr:DUF6165 family protein [Ramlibacter sp.]
MNDPLLIPVSPGELLDKKTILEVKRVRIADPEKLANVEREWALLAGIAQTLLAQVDPAAGIAKLEAELLEVNSAIWDLENTVRACEKSGDFGAQFVATARRIYSSNDHRAQVKRRINLLLDAAIVEEKEHDTSAAHGRPAA